MAPVARAAEPEKPLDVPLTEDDRSHWAFRTPVQAELPAVQDPDWCRNAIDRFILADLESAGLSPSPEASRRTLIRRLSFDLRGLPPTPQEVDAFLSDESPDAYERLAERMLESPAYGQHWAQYWLDLARYAETDGFEHDKLRPEAWRYRDWVIKALNQDMGYDEFLRLQLAGDESGSDNPDDLIATGFLLCGPDMPDINLKSERSHMVLNEMTSTIGAAVLGLQIGCAQCHDHKYDPVSQADFYRLRAVFANVDLFKKHPAGRVLQESDAKPPKSHLMIRGDFDRPGPELEAAFPRITNPMNQQIPPPEEEAKTTGRRTALARWLTRPEHPLSARVMVNRIWQHHFIRPLVGTPSDYGLMGEAPTHEALLDFLAVDFIRQGWSMKSMHLAMVTSATYRQVTGPRQADKPLAEVPPEGDGTSGIPDVDSGDNSGGDSGGDTEGDTAASRAPALREEVGQAQARQEQARQEASRQLQSRQWQSRLEIDPENELFSRMHRRRLTGEATRDAMLAVADRLNPKTGGRGVMAPLPEELLGTIREDHWSVDEDPDEHRRRSIYLFARRNLRYPLFEVFDRPDALASCPRRDRSITATQALTMLNGAFSLDAARHLAGFVLDRAGNDPQALVELAFHRALSRPPSAEELQGGVEFLRQQAAQLSTAQRAVEALALPLPEHDAADPFMGAALTDLCLALLNLNEFVYID
jgi:hypothetical protein